jgi:hypothetical protein
MKKLTFVLAALLCLGLAVDMHAQSAQATASASATIVTPIGITKSVDLNFGNIAAGTTASTVKIDTVGARTVLTGTAILPATTGSPTAAKFQVTGTPSFSYGVTPPGVVTIVSGGNNMTVDTWVTNPTGLSGGLLSAGGTQPLTVGGVLHVAAGQAAGVYTATFNITVVYN